ncbi:MAG: DUF374 domain-containing protein [Deltaproteobacteria bacterium]|nr:MAG: DUF374 domain-containing protein [Deltaproteobacteria bacterium]
MSYRVDNIPFWLKPFYLIYSYVMGWFLYALAWSVQQTCRIEFVGLENLESSPNHIFSAWHTYLGPYFSVFVKHEKPHAWINHPLWFMKPIHILLDKIGIQEIILGSAGRGGKDAADQLVTYLQKGYSTLINPDGPAGPPRVLKKGVLHLALASGVTVIPMKIGVSHYLTLKTWDTKRITLPFSKITVVYEKPVRVTQENFENAGKVIAQAMG